MDLRKVYFVLATLWLLLAIAISMAPAGALAETLTDKQKYLRLWSKEYRHVNNDILSAKRKKKKRNVHTVWITLSYQGWHDWRKLKRDARRLMSKGGQRVHIRIRWVDLPFPNLTEFDSKAKSEFLTKVRDVFRVGLKAREYNVLLLPCDCISGIAYAHGFPMRIAIVWGARYMRGYNVETLVARAIAHELAHLRCATHREETHCVMNTWMHGYTFKEWDKGNLDYLPEWCVESKQEMKKCRA